MAITPQQPESKENENMAYNKKGKARKSGSGTSRYTSRKSSARRTSTKRTGRSGRSVNTIRIVVEQPQAVSSVGPAPTASAKPARKAMF